MRWTAAHRKSRWSLRKHCKRIYFDACWGDERALADMRAVGDTIRKKKNWERFKKGLTVKPKRKTKKMKKLLISLVAVSLIAMTGCKQLTPQAASTLTTAAVYAFGRNNPKIVTTMRQIQPAACDIAKNPGSTVEDVVGVIENYPGVSEDTKAVVQVLLAIYQTSIAPVGTNQSKTHPYLEAVICPGWAGGLALLPSGGANAVSAMRNAPAPGKWVLVK